MDAPTGAGAGDSDHRARESRTELLRALLAERYDRPAWTDPKRAALIAHRRRILLGRDRDG